MRCCALLHEHSIQCISDTTSLSHLLPYWTSSILLRESPSLDRTQRRGQVLDSASTDRMLHLETVVPDFEAATSMGPMRWHEWLQDSWAILLSFAHLSAPICTYEVGCLALKYKELQAKDVRIAALSLESVASNTKWLSDILAQCEKGVTVNFPIIADPECEIATKYGIVDPNWTKNSDSQQLISASAFIIGPGKVLKLSFNYPTSVDRNIDEIMRCVSALQMCAKYPTATSTDSTIRPNITDSNNGPFLLPTVTPEDAQKTFGINHRGFVVMGIDDTPGQKAYYIHLEAKPGKGDKVQQFLRDINSGVDQEPLTGPWFALRYSSTTFGIFEAFPNADARHTHDGGPGGRNFLQAGLLHDMLAYPAQLYRLDVLHGKFNVMFGKPITT